MSENKKHKSRRIMACLLAAFLSTGVMTGAVFAVNADEPARLTAAAFERSASADFSDEYKTSPFYTRLTEALEEHESSSTMERALAAALSQEGYKNYATEGIDVEEARQAGLLWTGIEKRMNENNTGNTEYTRWAQRYIMNGSEESQYLDCDWCAIFISWCMYQAGYYTEDQLKKYYYSYCADPRIEYDADTWIEAFNLEQENVWYTPLSAKKLEAYDWNQYVYTDVDPYDIPYQPGGLIFFSWNGSGKYFNHVGMVVDYDPETHVLTYTDGNADGEVAVKEMDFDVEEEYRQQPFLKNSDRIMAYGEYDVIQPLEKREITADTTSIVWDKNAAKGITIQTDSKSKIASVIMDEKYYGSIIESNMLLRYGTLSIGKSELVGLSEGKHKMMLKFDDGSVDIDLTITNIKELNPDHTVFLWNTSRDSDLVIHTESTMNDVFLYQDDNLIADSDSGNIRIENGTVTLSPSVTDCLDPTSVNVLRVETYDGSFIINIYLTDNDSDSLFQYVIENDTDNLIAASGALESADNSLNVTSKTIRSLEPGSYHITVFRSDDSSNVSLPCSEITWGFENESGETQNIRINYDSENDEISVETVEPVVFEADQTHFDWSSATDGDIILYLTHTPEKAALLTEEGELLADETNDISIVENTVIISAYLLHQLPDGTANLTLVVSVDEDSTDIPIQIRVTISDPEPLPEESSQPESSTEESSQSESSTQESSRQTSVAPTPSPDPQNYPKTGDSTPFAVIAALLISGLAGVIVFRKKNSEKSD